MGGEASSVGVMGINMKSYHYMLYRRRHGCRAHCGSTFLLIARARALGNPTMSAAVLLIDGECAANSLGVAVAREACVSLVCSLATPGLWPDGAAPEIGLVRGAQLQMMQIHPKHELDFQAWSVELARLLHAHAATPLATLGDAPGIASLLSPLPPKLLCAQRLTFMTLLGGRSCMEAALRPVLASLEERDQHLELLLVGSLADGVGCRHAPHDVARGIAFLPPELILLQSEFDFSVVQIADRLEASAWVASTLAERQAVDLHLHLPPIPAPSTPRAGDAERDESAAAAAESAGGTEGLSLRCSLQPALLGETVAVDALACVCHGAPLAPLASRHPSALPLRSDGVAADPRAAKRSRSATGATAPRPAPAGDGFCGLGSCPITCPISQLALDNGDLKVVGVAGRLLWPCGSLAAEAAAAHVAGGTGHEGARRDGGGGDGGWVLTLEAQEGATGKLQGPSMRPSMRLRARRRIPLSSLDLCTLFGHPWRLVPLPASETLAEDAGTGAGGAAGRLRALSRRLHANAEALLCECTGRLRFGTYGSPSAFLSAPNADSLLARSVLLLPSGPPHHCLQLKAAGSPGMAASIAARQLR